jgi:hypothetical protein
MLAINLILSNTFGREDGTLAFISIILYGAIVKLAVDRKVFEKPL